MGIFIGRFGKSAGGGGTTYSIIGDVVDNQSSSPIPSVTLTGSGGLTGTKTTDSNGRYSWDGLPGNQAYTITPSKAGYTFSPTSRSGTLSNASTTANFVGTPPANAYDPINYFTGGTAGPNYQFDIAADVKKAGGSIAADGEAVETVEDHGAANIDATQTTGANKPLVRANSINSNMQSIENVDTDDFLACSGMDSFLNAASSVTIGAVFKPLNGSTNHNIFFQFDSSYSFTRIRPFLNGLQPSIDYNPDTANNGNMQIGGAGQALAADTWAAVLWQVDAANRTVAVYANNGTVISPTVVTGPAQNFSNGGNESRFLKLMLGKTAHVFVHKNALMTTQQRADWFAVVKSKYGLTAY